LLSCLEFGCINRHPLFIQAQIFCLTYPFMIHGIRKCYVLRVTNDITLYGILGFVNMSFLNFSPVVIDVILCKITYEYVEDIKKYNGTLCAGEGNLVL